MKTTVTILTVAVLFHTAQSLTCLQCDNIPQPRHCNAVTECDKDEICGVEEVIDGFGDQLYNVGCMKNTKCLQSNNTHHCITCCASDLCNAEGCQQSGYPQKRGPVCYNCPVHTNSKPCHLIDVCQPGEVCMFDVRSEFGDLVYSSRCSDVHACRQGMNYETALVGRNVEGIVEPRSLTEHVCRDCCDKDLCNKACNGSTPPGPCASSPCAHGTCREENGRFFCVCDQGFGGKQCNFSTNHCMSNPCYHGQCYDVSDNYLCVCDRGFIGTQCNTSTNHCMSNPCYHGQCYDVSDNYICVCDRGFIGTQCDTSTNHCQSNPCYHGQCHNGLDDYFCVCDPGFNGKQCNTSTNNCQSNPCYNGQCRDGFKNDVCICDPGFTGNECNVNISLVNDCYDLLHMNITDISGVYNVTLWRSAKVIEVYCDMDTGNGGWTVFQRRFNGSVDFYRTFSEYENGFGNVYGEFWLGLASIQEMTAHGSTELRLDLTAADGSHAYETFKNFSLGAGPRFTLHIDSGTGTAGDGSGLSYNNGHHFITYDRDNNNCAAKDRGGWWYDYCAYANLNGEYITPGTKSTGHSREAGVTYYSFKAYESLKETSLMFRKVTTY